MRTVKSGVIIQIIKAIRGRIEVGERECGHFKIMRSVLDTAS